MRSLVVGPENCSRRRKRMTDNRWFVRSIFTIGFVLLGLSPAVAKTAVAQGTRVVAGQVQDSSTKSPLPGVRVQIVGTTVSTSTDATGRYALDVPVGRDSIAFARIGYKRVVAAIAPAVDIAMQAQAFELQGYEVVTTPLGIERESRSLSNSAQTLSGERLSNVPTQNVVSSLGGKVAGVQVTNSSSPFGSARIVVRGASSILGQNQPLIVVDGIPIDNSAASNDGYGGGSLGGYDVGNAAADISADNIASVTVLKGPNAAALYGSRAANGAIVYTTKSGKGAP